MDFQYKDGREIFIMGILILIRLHITNCLFQISLNDTILPVLAKIGQNLVSLEQYFYSGVEDAAVWLVYANPPEVTTELYTTEDLTVTTSYTSEATTEHVTTPYVSTEAPPPATNFGEHLNVTLEMTRLILDDISTLLIETENNLRHPVETGIEFIEEMHMMLYPKCEVEINRFYGDYLDIHIQVVDMMDFTKTTIASYNDTFTDHLGDYETNNITLMDIADDVTVGTMTSDLTGLMLSMTGLLNERAIAVQRLGAYLNIVNYWFYAQFNDTFLTNSSVFWQRFGLEVNIVKSRHLHVFAAYLGIKLLFKTFLFTECSQPLIYSAHTIINICKSV